MAVADTLEGFLRRHEKVAEDPLAAAAMALALELDNPSSAAALASCASSFQKIVAELRRLAPEEKAGGTVDDLQKRREAKLRATGT
jgi:hypothetical protein